MVRTSVVSASCACAATCGGIRSVGSKFDEVAAVAVVLDLKPLEQLPRTSSPSATPPYRQDWPSAPCLDLLRAGILLLWLPLGLVLELEQLVVNPAGRQQLLVRP